MNEKTRNALIGGGILVFLITVGLVFKAIKKAEHERWSLSDMEKHIKKGFYSTKIEDYTNHPNNKIGRPALIVTSPAYCDLSAPRSVREQFDNSRLLDGILVLQWETDSQAQAHASKWGGFAWHHFSFTSWFESELDNWINPKLIQRIQKALPR